MGPTAGMDDMEKKEHCPCQEQSPSRKARSLPLHRLSYRHSYGYR
jgi:hypothetical protein